MFFTKPSPVYFVFTRDSLSSGPGSFPSVAAAGGKQVPPCGGRVAPITECPVNIEEALTESGPLFLVLVKLAKLKLPRQQ